MTYYSLRNNYIRDTIMNGIKEQNLTEKFIDGFYKLLNNYVKITGIYISKINISRGVINGENLRMKKYIYNIELIAE